MKSLWARYYEEFNGTEVIETEWGFIAFSYLEFAVFISEIYVVPEMRDGGLGNRLLEEVTELGRKAGKASLLSNVRIGTNVSAEAMKAHLAVGFIPISAEPDKILFRRMIEAAKESE